MGLLDELWSVHILVTRNIHVNKSVKIVWHNERYVVNKTMSSPSFSAKSVAYVEKKTNKKIDSI